MRVWRAYIAYIKDNPEHYWFKRKLYGWGWTPATIEGWLVFVAFIIFLLSLAWHAEKSALSGTAVFWELLLPLFIAIFILLAICYKTGESPRWQWHLPEKYFKD